MRLNLRANDVTQSLMRLSELASLPGDRHAPFALASGVLLLELCREVLAVRINRFVAVEGAEGEEGRGGELPRLRAAMAAVTWLVEICREASSTSQSPAGPSSSPNTREVYREQICGMGLRQLAMVVGLLATSCSSRRQAQEWLTFNLPLFGRGRGEQLH